VCIRSELEGASAARTWDGSHQQQHPAAARPLSGQKRKGAGVSVSGSHISSSIAPPCSYLSDKMATASRRLSGGYKSESALTSAGATFLFSKEEIVWTISGS